MQCQANNLFFYSTLAFLVPHVSYYGQHARQPCYESPPGWKQVRGEESDPMAHCTGPIGDQATRRQKFGTRRHGITTDTLKTESFYFTYLYFFYYIIFGLRKEKKGKGNSGRNGKRHSLQVPFEIRKRSKGKGKKKRREKNKRGSILA
ncbi:hypothetical protein L873DRAFT_425092 [Choiromyces venosus 120613-1]|uniref:Secreted protein n=1 Tax=Choiromyces venosus 120613-1 TaxID=1336337 RepID=A0A3N4JWB7_9PEZI|nr:hypothetical protein L873DRAFT_425092 [Choiromyces venosus 120613-1]